jgi:hypothetical protein
VDRILHSILEEVVPCIGIATRLAVGCRPGDSYYRCCFLLADKMCFVDEVIVAGAAVAEALVVRAHVPIDKDILLHGAVLSVLLFPVRFAAA